MFALAIFLERISWKGQKNQISLLFFSSFLSRVVFVYLFSSFHIIFHTFSHLFPILESKSNLGSEL